VTTTGRTPQDDARYARLAARLLAGETAAETAIGLGDRESDLAAIQRALRARARSRARPWQLGGLIAVAAAVALFVATRRPAPPDAPLAARPAPGRPAPARPAMSIAMLEGSGASVQLDGGERAVAVGDEVAQGTRLRVPASGGVTLSLVTGTRLDLAGGAAVRVAELDAVQRFELAAGSVTAKVAKLGPGQRFLVSTPDAEVEVKGTRFEVAIAPEPAPCGQRLRTRVTVQEGVVAVRAGATTLRLGPGSHWPDCDAPAATATSAARRALAEPARARAARPARTAVASPPEAARPSTLADQNDLFAAALAAGRRGDSDEAVRWLDQMIARYPTGQLSDRARAERARLTGAPGQTAPGE